MDEDRTRQESNAASDIQALGKEGLSITSSGNECSNTRRVLAECDGKSCNIVGAVTVEWCTACSYLDAGCGGFDY